MSAIFDGPDMFDPEIFDTKSQFTVSLSENVPVSDSVTTLRTTFRGIVESDILITCSVVRNATKFRTFAENTTISELLTVLKDRIASKTDTSTLCLQTEDDSDLCL